MTIRYNFFLFITIFLGAIFLASCGSGFNMDGNDGKEKSVSGQRDDVSADEVYPELTITFSHNQSPASTEHIGAERFKEVIEEESGGNITVDIYPSSQLGSLREQVESTQLGEIDITMQPAAVITPFVDDVKIIDLPYLWPTDAEEMYQVLDSEVGTEILEFLEGSGLEGHGFWPGGYKVLTTNNVPINKPEDLEGLTMRTMESPVLAEQFQHWGGNAIPVAYSEVYNALQLGIVDGQENPIQTVYMNNYYEVQNNIIESYHGSMTYMLISNQEWFNSLDDNVQKLIVHAEEEGRMASRESLAEKEDEYRQEIIDSGVNYYEFTDEEVEEFRAVTEPLWKEVYDTPEQLDMLEKVRNKIKEVEG